MSDYNYVWKALLAEFIGTFTLVFIGGSAVAMTINQGGSLVGSALAFGLALVAIIYIWGSYSGAHVNPAVSFGFAVAGQMNWLLMIGYWIAQLLGGIAAAALIAYFYGTGNAGVSIGSVTNVDAWKAILLEAFLTFFLVLAYLFVYRNPMLAIISGLAIGTVLTFAMLAGGPLTGASLNPARSLGPAIFGNTLGSIWIYIIGPLLGALVAALIYRLFVNDWGCCDKVDDCGNKVLNECGKPIKVCKRPIVDGCGNKVRDCNGKVMYEDYEKIPRNLTHLQETPITYIGQWMSSHGLDPRFLAREVDNIVAKVAPAAASEIEGGALQNMLTGNPQLMPQTQPTKYPEPSLGQKVGQTVDNLGQGVSRGMQNMGQSFSSVFSQ